MGAIHDRSTVQVPSLVLTRIPGDDPDEKTDRVLRQTFGISEAALVAATWDELATLHRG